MDTLFDMEMDNPRYGPTKPNKKARKQQKQQMTRITGNLCLLFCDKVVLVIFCFLQSVTIRT